MLGRHVIGFGGPTILDAARVRSLTRQNLHRHFSRKRAHAAQLNLQGRKKCTRDYRAGISGFYREEFTGIKKEYDRVVRHCEVLIVRGIVSDTRG